MNNSDPGRSLHRLAGILVAIPILIWMSTGLLFHIKHRYVEAYEQLQTPAERSSWDLVTVNPAQLVRQEKLDADGPISLSRHPSGVMVYFAHSKGRPVAIDGASGKILPPASAETARQWAQAAVAQSPHAARYGAPLHHEQTAENSLTVFFSGGKQVSVNLLTGELAQQGALNKWIDLTYRIHYLQWTPWQAVNIAFVLFAALAVVALAVSGIWMAVKYFRA